MRVLIVGGSSGIGKGLALKHAAQGHDLIISARTRGDLHAAQQECLRAGAASCLTVAADATDMRRCLELKELVGTSRTLDMLYITLGRGSHQVGGTAWDTTQATTDVYENMMRVNFFGCLNVLRAMLPVCELSRTHIVVFNSASGLVGLPGRAAYCASKAALSSVCETLIADHPNKYSLTEVFIVSVSGTNLRQRSLTQGVGAPIPHKAGGGGSSEVPVDQVVERVFKEVKKRTRRVYIPGRLRAAPVVKHLPFIPADKVLEKMVWAKARL